MSTAGAAAPRHLLTVWNPAYASDALDEHLRILIAWEKKYRAGDVDQEDVYVWWAKLHSTSRDGALPHRHEITSIQQQIDAGIETHLYLTDYRSLYVAWLEEITDDDVMRDTAAELDHIPPYYKDRRIDFFFRVIDVRRIVSDDTPAVIEELKQLSNTRFHDRPVSIYGGMVELPLIVTRADGKSWFDERMQLTGGELWARQDSHQRGETDRMGHELRDNLFGHVIWSSLDPASRTFLASADAVYRVNRDDPAFDFSGPAVGYAKAVEADLNNLVLHGVRDAAARVGVADRLVHVDSHPLDLGHRVAHQPLGKLAHLLSEDAVLNKLLKVTYPHDYKWLTGELPSHLAPIVAVRNPAAHSEATTRAAVDSIRESVLGIGHEGLISKLARIRIRALG